MTITTKVWAAAYHNFSSDDLIAPTKELAQRLIYTDVDMAEHGYANIGVAHIVLDLASADAVLVNRVATLRAEKTKVQAEAFARCTQIEGQIQNLLAITYQAAP